MLGSEKSELEGSSILASDDIQISIVAIAQTIFHNITLSLRCYDDVNFAEPGTRAHVAIGLQLPLKIQQVLS